jgi:hypothetical protein
MEYERPVCHLQAVVRIACILRTVLGRDALHGGHQYLFRAGCTKPKARTTLGQPVESHSRPNLK